MTRVAVYCGRLAVAGFAAANVMLLSVSIWSGADPQTRDLFHWISALIALPAVIYAGGTILFVGRQCAAPRPSEYGCADLAWRHPCVRHELIRDDLNKQEHAFFDAAVTLLFFLLIGRYLDHLMRARARSAVSQLMTLAVSGATIVEPDGEPPLRRKPRVSHRA